MTLLRTLGVVLVFVGILAGCLALVLLVILMVRFPPLPIAVVLACWILCRLRAIFGAPEVAPTKPPTASQ